MTQNVAYMFNNNGESLTIFLDGNSYTVRRNENPNWDNIVSALLEKNYDGLLDMVNIKQAINRTGDGRVVVDGDTVYYDGKPLHNALVNKIIAMVQNGLPVTNMLKFLENLLENPSNTAINELYLFLESGNLPLTEDGHFLAYKKVRGDYLDIYSGTISNKVGSVVEIPRRDVDDNRNRTCSHGLHFCSKDYLPHFGVGSGSRVVILKINPKDVVSIPSDYNNTKGRTCRYEVIGEWDGYDTSSRNTEAFSRPYYSSADLAKEYNYGDEDDDWLDDEDEWNLDESEISQELIDWANTVGLVFGDPEFITGVTYGINSVTGDTEYVEGISDAGSNIRFDGTDKSNIDMLKRYLQEQADLYNVRAKLKVIQVKN